MRFKVSRTSGWNESKPCDTAVKGEIQSWDYRTCKTPEEFNDRKLGDWFGEGTTEHGTYGSGKDRGIKRRRHPDREAWFVEVGSLEELMAFWELHGDLVITTAHEDRQTPEIEIYDGWRE